MIRSMGTLYTDFIISVFTVAIVTGILETLRNIFQLI